jgi:hypothetical protein
VLCTPDSDRVERALCEGTKKSQDAAKAPPLTGFFENDAKQSLRFVSLLIICSFFLDKKRTKKIKPRRSARPPLDFLESRQKVASTFARDCYGNQFTAELLRAAAGSRAGQNKKRQLIY